MSAITTFEDPRKTEMRAAAEVALDQAGYQIVSSLAKVALPSPLKGVLQGDLQSLDGQDKRTFYFLRAAAENAVPQWLANIARASHELRAGEMYVVVREHSAAFRQSCIDAGAGLLVLTEDSTFEVVIAWDEVLPRDLDAELQIEAAKLRRSMEQKLKLLTEEVASRHHRITLLVSDMDSTAAGSYLKRIEAEYKLTDDWGLNISGMLDSISVDNASTLLPAISSLIDQGPTIPDDETAAS